MNVSKRKSSSSSIQLFRPVFFTLNSEKFIQLVLSWSCLFVMYIKRNLKQVLFEFILVLSLVMKLLVEFRSVACF